MAVSIADLLEAIHVEQNDANQKAVVRIRDAVNAVIATYAPDAPDAVKFQACVQCVGYVWESPASAPARMNFANALQNSGAAALLAPWRVHRAGVIGGAA